MDFKIDTKLIEKVLDESDIKKAISYYLSDYHNIETKSISFAFDPQDMGVNALVKGDLMTVVWLDKEEHNARTP